ncbi:MAG: hypothetical protein JWN98_2692 [Abditibacteriota bacterium]|nr:hypothetical protein [Abditibacteriota bacterium]
MLLSTVLLLTTSFATSAHAQGSKTLAPKIGTSSTMRTDTSTGQDQVIQSVDFERKLNSQIPLDATFRDSNGETVQLSKYFKGKPVVFELIFYNCTMLCSEVMNGTLRLIKDPKLGFQMGRDFDVVTVSIDPTETPELAAAKKKTYLKELGNPPGAEEGWHLLVGDKKNIDKLADSIGYRYSYDKATAQYAHAGGLVVATPAGKVARYFYGVDYPGQDVRFGLIEASNNKIGSVVEKAVLFLCFHYNATDGKYSFAVMKLVQLAALATLLGLGCGIFLMRRVETRMLARAKVKKTDPAPAEMAQT